MMTKYVLDSNVFSEIHRKNVNENVKQKFLLHKSQAYLASTVWSEMFYGMSILPDGRRKEELKFFLNDVVAYFPILAYDKQSATIHAQIRADCRKKGKTLAFADSQIASIAMANNAVLVTRNVSDFEGVEGLKIENWFG